MPTTANTIWNASDMPIWARAANKSLMSEASVQEHVLS
jgi:hypothetical protein